MSDNTIQIAGRTIGLNRPAYVVAELSANHRQSFEYAVKIMEAARDAGADAIKLQTYTPDTITIQSDSDLFRISQGGVWEGRTLYDLYSEAFMPWEWQPRLKKIAAQLKLDFFSSPFDKSAVDFLERMDVPAYKIASFELGDLPLIRYAAATGKPVILSTGMSTLAEIEEAVASVRSVDGFGGLALLKCTSAYPAPPEQMNLRTIPDLVQRFKVPVGLSDHTTGVAVPVAAVTLGACIVEKHLTLSRADGGPDSSFSLEPREFAEMVQSIRTAEGSLGSVQYGALETEERTRALRRSLFITEDLVAGSVLSTENLRSIRPGFGLPPKYLETVLGRSVKKDVPRGTPLQWDLLL